MPSITNLATKTVLNVVENKIPRVSNLVTETYYNTKINEIEKNITDHNHDKYITIAEFNKLTSDNINNLTATLKQSNFVTKAAELDNKLANFNKRITSNKTKHLALEKKLERLITKELIRIYGIIIEFI